MSVSTKQTIAKNLCMGSKDNVLIQQSFKKSDGGEFSKDAIKKQVEGMKKRCKDMNLQLMISVKRHLDGGLQSNSTVKEKPYSWTLTVT